MSTSGGRHLEGAFATGHTAFEGAAQATFYTQTLKHEFDEEYKQVHDMRKPCGPGRMEMPDWQAKRRGEVDLPITGTDIQTRQGGSGEKAYVPNSSCLNARSSNAIGGFWNDPIFKDPPALKQTPVESIGTRTRLEPTLRSLRSRSPALVRTPARCTSVSHLRLTSSFLQAR